MREACAHLWKIAKCKVQIEKCKIVVTNHRRARVSFRPPQIFILQFSFCILHSLFGCGIAALSFQPVIFLRVPDRLEAYPTLRFDLELDRALAELAGFGVFDRQL